MTDQFEKDFFQGAEVISVEVHLLTEQWGALKTVFVENEWSDDEGFQYVLAAGLSAIKNQEEALPETLGEEDQQKAIERLLRERIELESRYAVMRYRTYQFMQAAKVMEWKLNAARVELDGLKKANQRLRQQLE